MSVIKNTLGTICRAGTNAFQKNAMNIQTKNPYIQEKVMRGMLNTVGHVGDTLGHSITNLAHHLPQMSHSVFAAAHQVLNVIS